MKAKVSVGVRGNTERENSAVGIWHTDESGAGYDCYCSACEWSGDIWPDDEADND